MEYIGLPLNVDERGWLVRNQPAEVLLAFIRAAALTYRNTWPADPEFGLHDEFDKPWRVGLPQDAINTLNRSLARFGWTDIQVLSIKRIPSREDWAETSYEISLATPDRSNMAVKLNLPATGR